MIPKLKPCLGLAELLASLRLPQKDDVSRFETAFAREMRQKHAIAFPYGRTALIVILKALGLKGKEVICPAYTCVVVAHAIVESGNNPVFIDSKETDGNMDLKQLPKSISERTGAIIATSIFGHPCNLDLLDQFREDFGNDIPIIQDCAHSFGAEWKGRPVQQYGLCAFLGLNVSKMITSIFGGMVTTDDDDFAEKLRLVREEYMQPGSWLKSIRRLLYLLALYPTFWEPLYFLVAWLDRIGALSYFTQYYMEDEITIPYDFREGMTGIEARVGKVQLKRYKEIVASRRKYASYYQERLKDLKSAQLFPLVDGATYSHILALVASRADAMKRASERGVQLGQVIEYSIPLMKAYRNSVNTEKNFPVSKRFSDCIINLPVSGCFREQNAAKTVEIMKELFR